MTDTWYRAQQAVQLLRERHWINTNRRELFARLVAAGIARRTCGGYQLVNPALHSGLLRNHFGLRTGTTESGQLISRHTVAIRFSDAGLDWIANTINLETAA